MCITGESNSGVDSPYTVCRQNIDVGHFANNGCVPDCVNTAGMEEIRVNEASEGKKVVRVLLLKFLGTEK